MINYFIQRDRFDFAKNTPDIGNPTKIVEH